MGALLLFSAETYPDSRQRQGWGYDFTFFANESMLLFFGENESTILLFGVGREYDFTDEQKESGGTGVISSDAAFSVLTVVLTIFLVNYLGSGNQLVDAGL